MSPGPSGKIAYAAALSVVNSDDVHKRWCHYHTRKIPSRRSGTARCSTIGILNQKTPISMTQKTHAWWASRQHGIKGISKKTCMETNEYPINTQQRDLKTQHDKSWQQVHCTDNSTSHQARILKTSNKQDPTSSINKDLWNTMHRKISTWIH